MHFLSSVLFFTKQNVVCRQGPIHGLLDGVVRNVCKDAEFACLIGQHSELQTEGPSLPCGPWTNK